MQSNVNGFCPPMKTVGLQSQLSTCVFDIAKWMGANWLQWTQPRSKSCGAAHISDHSSTQSAISCLWQFCHPVIHCSWSGCVITHSAWLSTSPRSTPDASLRWDSYATCDSLLSQEFFIRLVMALVLPRLDYCNGGLAELSANQLSHLQCILHAAAWLI